MAALVAEVEQRRDAIASTRELQIASAGVRFAATQAQHRQALAQDAQQVYGEVQRLTVAVESVRSQQQAEKSMRHQLQARQVYGQQTQGARALPGTSLQNVRRDEHTAAAAERPSRQHSRSTATRARARRRSTRLGKAKELRPAHNEQRYTAARAASAVETAVPEPQVVQPPSITTRARSRQQRPGVVNAATTPGGTEPHLTAPSEYCGRPKRRSTAKRVHIHVLQERLNQACWRLAQCRAQVRLSCRRQMGQCRAR